MNGTAKGGSEYELKTMQHCQREVIRLLALGHKHNAIAKYLGLNADTVTTICNSEVTKQHLERIQSGLDDQASKVSYERMKEIIEVEAPQSLDVLVQIRDGIGEFANVSPSLRFNAAAKLVAMAGHGEIKNVRADVVHTDRISPADIRAIRAAIDGERIKEGLDDVIDAEFSIAGGDGDGRIEEDGKATEKFDDLQSALDSLCLAAV